MKALSFSFLLTLVVLGAAEDTGKASDANGEVAAGAANEGENAESKVKQPLKCFVCNSYVEGETECSDDFDGEHYMIQEHFLKTCPVEEGKEVYCKKVKMWLQGETRVDRSCGYNKREYPEPCYQSRSDDHIVDTCQCDEEGCNSSPYSVSSSVFLILGAIALAYEF